MNYQPTQYGFDWGSAKVNRICSDKKKGWVILEVETPKENLQVYVTKTGKVRVYKRVSVKYVCGPKKGETFHGRQELK